MPPEAQVVETSVDKIVREQVKARGGRSDVKVVVPENFGAFVDEKLGKPEVVDPEAKAKEELTKVEAEKAARLAKEKEGKKDDEQDEEIDHPDETKKKGLSERFSKLTADRKAAEEREKKAAEEARAAREARDRAQDEARQLREKYEPAKPDELGPKPARAQFTSDDDFEKELMDWTADKTRMEDATKAEQERQARQAAETAKAWQERQAALRKEMPDYDDRIKNSDVKVSNEVRDAILDSEVGPRILVHLAENPDVATKIGEMTVTRALKEIGRLEAQFGDKGGDKGEKKETAKETTKTALAEISKAPAPISPLKGAGTPVVSLSGNDEVPASMNYETWKALRKAGKIK